MRRSAARFAAAVAAGALAVAGPGCGKKAPLRLPEQIRPEGATAVRASVREDVVTLRFRVPARRLFPEREDPWVLARVLRRAGAAEDFTEAAAVLEPGGLAFEGELAVTDPGRVAGVPLLYRVEFRDARRRRRAETPPLALSWDAVPGAPRGLAARGTPAAVSLVWEAPEGVAGVRYRIYRREGEGEAVALSGSETVATAFLDSRVRPGQRYCYGVRALLAGTGVEVEGPASAERCAAPEPALPPPAPAGLAARPLGKGYQLTWNPVDAPGIAGYFLYRAVGGGPLQRVTSQPVAGAVYYDEPSALPPGTVLRWVVTAVAGTPDNGESAMSPAASATAP